MTSPQLEHGHVRIANRLYEALLDAEFSGMQFKLLHGLIRLTYGWRSRTATLSHAELAQAIHQTPSGAFRAALRELIEEGVVVQVTQGTGHTKSTLALQKDFTRWGKFSVAPDRLARRYGTRPPTADHLLTDLVDAPPADAPPVGVPAAPPARIEAGGVPESRQAGCLEVGTLTTPNAASDGHLEGRKDNDSNRQTDAVVVGASTDVVFPLIRAANQGMRNRFGERFQPIHLTHGTSVQAAHDLAAAGIPTEFATSVIYDAATKLREPVRSLLYFERQVRDAWADEQARRDAAATGPPEGFALRPPGAGGAPFALAGGQRLTAAGRSALNALRATEGL